MKRRKTKRNPEAQRHLDEFRDRWKMSRCWLCETRNYVLHVHHIVGRKGDAYDNPRNLSSVCWLCHARIHGGEQTTIHGRKHAAWTDEDVERAKRRHDPDNWDPAYLDYLRRPEAYERKYGTMEYQE
jgi:hypothetical protein